ncbi:MAG: DUF4345 family protein [Actinomycetota bacterium]
MSRLAAPLLWIEAVIAFVFGLAFLVAPEAMFESATDAALGTPSAVIDVRATYAGMSIATAMLLAFFARRGPLRTGLMVSIVVWGSIAFARVIGFVFDGSANAIMLVNLALEVGAVLAGLLVLRSLDDGA